MAGVLGNLLILGIDETLKIKMRSAISGIATSVEIVVEKTTKGAYSTCFTHMPDAVFLEWKVFPPEEITVFLQKLRKHRFGHSVPVVLISEKVTPQVLAVAAEYDIFQVVTDVSSPSRLKALMRTLANEALQPAPFVEKYEALQIVAARGDQTAFARMTEELFQQFPDVPQARFEYANLCLKTGKIDEAREVARKALSHNPHNLRANNILARAHLLSKDYDKALTVLQNAEASSPRNLDRLIMLGDAFAGAKRPPEARRAYESALKVDPASVEAAAGLVAADGGEANLNETISLLRGAQSSEERASLFNTAGIIAARRKDIDHASALYATALSFLESNKPLQARVQFNYALALERAGLREQAVSAHQKAHEMDPKFQKSQARLALLGGDHLQPPPPLPDESDAELEVDFDDLTPVEDAPQTPTLIEMVSTEKVLKPFPVRVIKK